MSHSKTRCLCPILSPGKSKKITEISYKYKVSSKFVNNSTHKDKKSGSAVWGKTKHKNIAFLSIVVLAMQGIFFKWFRCLRKKHLHLCLWSCLTQICSRPAQHPLPWQRTGCCGIGVRHASHHLQVASAASEGKTNLCLWSCWAQTHNLPSHHPLMQ